MKVLITGGTGFIGRHLSMAMLHEGYEVYVLSRKDRFTEDYPFKDEVNLVVADLRDGARVEDALMKVRPNIVIHMAALTPVRFSFDYKMVLEYMRVNYEGTVNLIEASQKSGVELFVHYSTAEAYFSKDMPHHADEPVGGETPYAISKSAGELYARYAWKAGKIPKLLVLRPCNTYDRSIMGRESVSRGYFVEKTVISMLKRFDEIKYDGSPKSKRSWIHISDHVECVIKWMDMMDKMNEVMVISNIHGPEARCEEVFNICREITGWNGKVSWMNNPRPYDPECLTLENSCYFEDRQGECFEIPTDFKPKPLKEGLKLAVKNWRRKLEELGEL